MFRRDIVAYFDNAATTYPKPEKVYSYMDSFYRTSGANAGRGHYELAQTAGNLIANTRKQIQTLLHCPTKIVVFEPTATIALNIIIQGIIKKGAKNVYISPFEHNAVTRMLHHYEINGELMVQQLSVTEKMVYDFQRIRYQFDAIKPDFVIVSHASNVFGLVAPVENIFALAKKYDAVTLVDMAQTAGLVDCNIGSDLFDFAVFAGHKTLYGPTGIAGFVMSTHILPSPILFGGTGFDSANKNMPESIPERYEMGTLNICGIAGLHAALDWNSEKTIGVIWQQEEDNRKRLIDLLNEYEFITIIGNYEHCKYVGIVSCLIRGISSDSAGNIFDRCGIAVRTGLQCAPMAHQFMKTYPTGTVRFSVSFFTSDEDFERLRQGLDCIEDNL